jgi:hypothetical protein
MKFTPINPPRVFNIGRSEVIQMKDCAHIELQPDEQVTFVTESGAEYDVARKSWGFYATPSLNGRLSSFGLRGALVKSLGGRFYILLVESGKEADFQRYLDAEGHSIVSWLDTDSELEALERKLRDV